MLWRRRKKREQDLERELRSDLELEAAEQQEVGLSEEEARYAARRALGNTNLVKENVREMWGWVFLDRLKQDVGYALRGMGRNPGFVATAVLSLALGIGANTAMFSLFDALLLRWLPVREPQELVQLTILRRSPVPLESFAYPLVRALAEHHEIFSNLCGFSNNVKFGVGQGDSLESISGAWVTGSYYETLGLQPIAGRLLTPADDSPGAVPVAVITDGYWQRKFGRNLSVIGQAIQIKGKPVIITGVSAAGFTGANVGENADITLPLGVLPQVEPDGQFQIDSGAWWLRVLARPQPGVSGAQVKARLDVIWPRITELVGPASRYRVQQSSLNIAPGGTGWTDLRRQFRKPLLVLLAVTGLLLLIACANVANLLLVRASARQREIAIRMAIGAGRARIVRQLLTETVLRSLCGAALGIALAWIGGRVLVDVISSGRLHALVLDVAPDWRVLGFTGLVALLTGVLFGMVPAFQGTAVGAPGTLRERIAISRSRFASLLVIAQVSLTLLLLIGAGLFVRTLQNLRSLDTGFQRNGVLLTNVNGAGAGYRGVRLVEFYADLLQKLERLPGIVSASFSLITPLAGGGISQPVVVNGQLAGQQEIYFNGISPHYFETMRTPVLLGREFTSRDTASSPKVAIVNQGFATRYFPNGTPLGQQLTLNSRTPAGSITEEFEVVGVVRDSIYESLRQAPPPTVYVPLVQRIRGPVGVTLEVRASGSLAQVAAALRTTLQPSFPNAPIEVRAFTTQVEQMLVQERLMATLAASFGILGLMLAVIGLYGQLAYTVARRTSEIGIRMALGALRREVVWLAMQDALMMLSVGVCLGLSTSWASSRFISSMLFGLTATDPSTIAVATAILSAAGVAAVLVPAWRASRVDPMVALRYE